MSSILRKINQNKNTEHYTNGQPYLWSYWENKPNKVQPEYIKLCYDIIKTKCSALYNIKILDEITVLDYLPNLRTDINILPLALKSDYIRIALLYKYGGLWVDADTLVMTDLKDIIDKLNDGWDYLGFGCSFNVCTDNGYPKPSNGVMASQPNSILMKNCLQTLDKKLDENKNKNNYGYYDLGKLIIWKEIELLQKNNNYTYYHYPAYVDGTRDKNGKWISIDLIKQNYIDLLDENKLMFVMLVNSNYCGDDYKFNWFCSKTKNDIINDKYFLAYLFKKSLGIK